MSPRQLRVDAVANRKRIMRAAREQIIEHGPQIGMNTIAVAAGVAVGTLYRNFPTKADLISAVNYEYAEEMVSDIEATAARVAAGAPVLAEIRAVAARFVEISAQNNAIRTAARVLTGGSEFGALESRANNAVNVLLTVGVGARVLRPDISIADFTLLVATAPADQPPAARARWLTIVLDGLTTVRD
jgi:AcrR family transcriptional regulator